MKTNKRQAEALPHIEQYSDIINGVQNDSIECYICDTSGHGMEEQDKLDFITAHRHKNITNLEKKV